MAIAQRQRPLRGFNRLFVLLLALMFGVAGTSTLSACGGCSCSYDDSTGEPTQKERIDGEVLAIAAAEQTVLVRVVATQNSEQEVGDELVVAVGRTGVNQLKEGSTYRFPISRNGDYVGSAMTSGCCPRPVITDLDGHEVYESAISTAWGQVRMVGVGVILVLVLIVPLTMIATALSRTLGRDFDA